MTREPIVHEVHLPCSAARAFEVYTTRIGEWWHPDYTMNPQTLRAVTIEPRAGGRVFATHDGAEPHVWGEVVVWEPGRRLVYTSTLAQTPEHPSEIRVTFTPSGGGCAMRFEHGGWNDENAADRRKFSDWPKILDRYTALI